MKIVDDIIISSYLEPHPLDEDSEIEEEFVSWLPGYTHGEDEEGTVPYWRDENIALYEKIERYTEETFRAALNRLWPLFSDIYLKKIFIPIDITGFISKGSSLAGYNYKRGNPAKGEYVFSVDQSLLNRYCHHLIYEKKEALPKINLWEHELIHLLDHQEIIAASAFMSSELPLNNLAYYIIKYREEGLANLFDLLDGKIKGISSIDEAKSKLKENYAKILQKLNQVEKTNSTLRDEIYSGYDFYEIGPWLILDMLEEMPKPTELIDIDTLIDKIASGDTIEDTLKMEFIEIASLINNNWFTSRMEDIIKT